MFLAQFLVAAGFAVIFPFLPLYVQALGSQTGLSLEFWAGMVFSSQAATMMVASPIWGVVADRYGRKLMVERAMFGGSIIILLMAFARSAEELALLRAVQGLITGTVSAANALVAAETPRPRAGYAMGILQVGFWAGIAVGPLLGGLLADLFGFRMPFIITAGLLLLGGVIVWWGVTEDYVPQKTNLPRPQLWREWHHILVTPFVSLLYVIRFLTYLGRTLLVPIMPLVIQYLLPGTAWASTMTGLVVAVASISTTLSAIYLGRLGDQIGHRRVLVVCALFGALAYFPQSIVWTTWQLLILQALAGAAFGGVLPLSSALLAQYTEPGEEGVVYGLDSSVGAGARTLAPLVGSGVAIWVGLQSTFIVSGLMFLLIAVIAVWGLVDVSPEGERL